jgi:hypothetical protein
MKASKFLVLVSVTLLVFVGACGNDGGQTSPVIDTVPPNPPVGVIAEDTGSTVMITWAENAEVDLAGYKVFRSSYEDGPFQPVRTSLVRCPWYYDDVTPAAMTFYRVTAVDESGNESAFSQIVGIYWNTGGRQGPSDTVER